MKNRNTRKSEDYAIVIFWAVTLALLAVIFLSSPSV